MPCTCITCPDCRGTGMMFNDRESRDLETCEECRGSGISDVCQVCRDKADAEEDCP